MEKFNANNLYYGVVEVRNKRIFETYKSILLKLNNKLYFDFKNEIIIEEKNNNQTENRVYHLQPCIRKSEKQISKSKILKKIKTIN